MNETLKQQFRDLFENEYPGIEILREKLIRPLWNDIGTPFLDIPVEQKDTNKIKKITIFATQNSDINFVDVELSDSIILKNNRVTINRYITNKIVDIYQSALIFFHYANNQKEWRISYVYKGDNNSDRTNAKRYTYLCGKGIYCRTAAERFSELEKYNGFPDSEKLINAFSVENLTKEFFGQLFNWYSEWACKVCMFPGDNCIAAHAELTTDKNEISLIRLITRIMFVWFIKQKNLIPSWIFNKEELNFILSDSDLLSEEKGNYYNAVLQNLFFGALNNKIENRSFAEKSEDGIANEQYGIKTYFRDANEGSFFKITQKEIIEKFIEVPFLNGGLFECLDKVLPIENKYKVQYVDGFSRNKDRRAFVPNKLFWNEDENQPGLITILSRYNFTVEESTPNDVQVALDPELLGKVFENLLGTFNPETRESARKESGSFYTPREIVSYMVNRSIMAYLKKSVPDVSDENLEKLTNDDKTDDTEIKLSNDQINKIRNALLDIKIIDPACGSGAFPMGILNKLVEIHVLLNFLQNKKDEKLYTLKMDIIEKSIFGVDIQPIAVQICKLRFFISLICEQPKIENHPELNYGYNPLPNLETKFVAANTLIGLDMEEKQYLDYSDNTITNLKNHLIEVRKNHFSSKTSDEKQENRKLDEKLRKAIIEYLKNNSFEINKTSIENIENQIKDLEKLKEKYPVKLENIEESDLFGNTIKKQIDKNADNRKLIDVDINKLKKDLETEKNKTEKTRTLEQLEELVKWNPYDQSADASSYFDSEWMFGIKDGFDIVIGNPPYISAPMQVANTQLAAQREKLVQSKKYKSLYQKWDLYIPFIEQGIQLNKPNGITAMIVPYPLTNQLYAKLLRKMLVEEYNLFELVDLNGTKVFENATVSNCIPFIQKTTTQEKTWISHINTLKEIYRDFIQKKMDLIQDKKTYVWNVTQEKREANRHSDMHVLGDYCYISKGMVLNSHEDSTDITFKKADLISDTEDKIHFRKFAEGKDCVKYAVNRIRYLEYDTERVPDKLSRPTFRELYTTPKLMFNRLGELQVFYDEKGDFTTSDAMFVCICWKQLHDVDNKSISSSIKKYSKMTRPDMEKLSEEVDLRYLLGVMNSKYASVLLTNLRGGDYHIYPEHIRNIPIPPATKEQQKSIIDIVDEILAAKKKDKNADISLLEKEIDKEVYKLYGITE